MNYFLELPDYLNNESVHKWFTFVGCNVTNRELKLCTILKLTYASETFITLHGIICLILQANHDRNKVGLCNRGNGWLKIEKCKIYRKFPLRHTITASKLS